MIYLILEKNRINNKYHESNFIKVDFYASPLKRLQYFCKLHDVNKLLIDPTLYLVEISGDKVTKCFSIPELKKMLLLL